MDESLPTFSDMTREYVDEKLVYKDPADPEVLAVWKRWALGDAIMFHDGASLMQVVSHYAPTDCDTDLNCGERVMLWTGLGHKTVQRVHGANAFRDEPALTNYGFLNLPVDPNPRCLMCTALYDVHLSLIVVTPCGIIPEGRVMVVVP